MTGHDQNGTETAGAAAGSMKNAEAAAILGRSDRQIRRMVAAGQLVAAGAGRVTTASVEAVAGRIGRTLPVVAEKSSDSGMVYVEKTYLESLVFEAIAGRQAQAKMLEWSDKGEAEAARAEALEVEVAAERQRAEALQAELEAARAALETEKKRPFWRRPLW